MVIPNIFSRDSDGAGGDMVLMEAQNPVGAASVTFANIAQIYRNLVFKAWLNTSTVTNAAEAVKWELNGETNAATYLLQDGGTYNGGAINGASGSDKSIMIAGGLGSNTIYNETILDSYSVVPFDGKKIGRSKFWWQVTGGAVVGQFVRTNTWNCPALQTITQVKFFGTGNLTGRIEMWGQSLK
jgi:hypothetical protein